MCMKHHYDRNRKAVQQGLDRRKEDALEAAQEAAGQALRDEMRRSNQRREAEKAAAEDAVCRRVAQVIEETDREMEQRREQLRNAQRKRDRKALEVKTWKMLLLHTFGSLMIAVALLVVTNLGIPVWLTLPLVVAACVYSIRSFVIYGSRLWIRKPIA